MLVLYEQGAGTTELGIRYQVDHSSIYYWVRKFGIQRKVAITPTQSRQRVHQVRVEMHNVAPRSRQKRYFPSAGEVFVSFFGEKPPKTYAQLLAESKERDRKRRLGLSPCSQQSSLQGASI